MDVSVHFESPPQPAAAEFASGPARVIPAVASHTSPPLPDAILLAPSPAPSVAAAAEKTLSPAVRYAPSPAPRDGKPHTSFEGLA